MLLAHAITLAEARSYVAALADNAVSIDASIEYDRVLLQIDFIHGDLIPAISPVRVTDGDALNAGHGERLLRADANGDRTAFLRERLCRNGKQGDRERSHETRAHEFPSR